MKILIILSNAAGELDRQTFDVRGEENESENIFEALKAWTLAPGDTITIREQE